MENPKHEIVRLPEVAGRLRIPSPPNSTGWKTAQTAQFTVGAVIILGEGDKDVKISNFFWFFEKKNTQFV